MNPSSKSLLLTLKLNPQVRLTSARWRRSSCGRSSERKVIRDFWNSLVEEFPAANPQVPTGLSTAGLKPELAARLQSSISTARAGLYERQWAGGTGGVYASYVRGATPASTASASSLGMEFLPAETFSGPEPALPIPPVRGTVLIVCTPGTACANTLHLRSQVMASWGADTWATLPADVASL